MLNCANRVGKMLKTPVHQGYCPRMNCEAVPLRFESEMASPLLSFISDAFRARPGQRVCVLQQAAIGTVIPDVLVGIWSGELPRLRGLNSVSRQILAWLSIEKTADSKEELREKLFISHNAAEAAISVLKRVGAITNRDSGELELQSEFDISGSLRLIAIEMKLKRWREALDQAISYRKFSDESYVVLDGNQVRITAEISNAFAGNGIGLFLQRGDRVECEIAVEPLTPIPSVDRLSAMIKLSRSSVYCLA
jgi:hypothetical protein